LGYEYQIIRENVGYEKPTLFLPLLLILPVICPNICIPICWELNLHIVWKERILQELLPEEYLHASEENFVPVGFTYGSPQVTYRRSRAKICPSFSLDSY